MAMKTTVTPLMREFGKLKRGDIVEIYVSLEITDSPDASLVSASYARSANEGSWEKASVRSVTIEGMPGHCSGIEVELLYKGNLAGRLFSYHLAHYTSPLIRLPKVANDGERLQANVFADWLEENGEQQAADKLRAAFPIIPRV